VSLGQMIPSSNPARLSKDKELRVRVGERLDFATYTPARLEAACQSALAAELGERNHAAASMSILCNHERSTC